MASCSIGIDIGSTHVRAVALGPSSRAERLTGQRARLLATAAVPRRDEDGDAKPLPAVLKEVMELLGRRGRITVHLGDAQTMVKFLATMPLPPDRLARVLRLELAAHADSNGDLAADAIPLPIEGDEVVHACVVSQPQALVDGLRDLAEAKIIAPAMHFAPAAIYNTLIGQALGPELPAPAEPTAAEASAEGLTPDAPRPEVTAPVRPEPLVLLVDIGATTTGVTLLGEDRFLACRQLPIGGNAFTEALVASGVERRRAEESKRLGGSAPSASRSPLVTAPAKASRPAPASASATAPVQAPTTVDGPALDDAGVALTDDLFADSPADWSKPAAAGGDVASIPASPVPAVAQGPVVDVSGLSFADEAQSSPDEDMLVLEDPAEAAPAAAALVFVESAEVSSPVARTSPVVLSSPAAPVPETRVRNDAPLELDDDLDPSAPVLGANSDAATGSRSPFAGPGQETSARGAVTMGPELTRAAEALYAQLASSVLWFRSQLRQGTLAPTKVLLAGGGAALPGLDAYLARRFGVPVERFTPFVAVAPTKKTPLPADANAWAAAVGLALADTGLSGKGAICIDLRPASLVAKDFYRRRLVWPYAAAIFLVLGTLCAGIGLARRNGAVAESLAALQEYQDRHTAQSNDLKKLQKKSDGVKEELRAIASRMYANRDILWAIQAFKEATADHPQLWLLKMETQALGAENLDADDDDGPKPKPRGGKKPKDEPIDTTIGRGQLLISGKIKYQDANGVDERGYADRNTFREQWQNRIRRWRPSGEDTPYLFIPEKMELIEFLDKESGRTKSRRKGGAEIAAGECGFIYKIPFQLARLEDVTAETRESGTANKEGAE